MAEKEDTAQESGTEDLGEISNQTYMPQDLFETVAVKLLDDTLVLMEDLNLVLDEFNSVIGDSTKLRVYAKDYKWLQELKDLVNDETKRGILIDILIHKVEDIQKVNPESAELIKELAQLVRRYGVTKTERETALETISKGLSEPEKLSSRIELLIDYAGRRIKDENVKKNIVVRLRIIQRYLGEIEALEYCVHDINDWAIHFPEDIHFFTGRIDGYFKGGLFRDRSGKEIMGINSFKDEELRKRVLESREVRVLYGIAQFGLRLAEQIEFIERDLISPLRSDIDWERHEWVRDVATKRFLAELEAHANTFLTKFSNKAYANALLKNKKIEEQPFVWIDFLEKMRKGLENLMPRKNVIIEDAGRLILDVFGRRKAELQAMLGKRIAEINYIILAETKEIDLVSQIKKAIERIENAMNRLWRKRKKRFKNLYDTILDMHLRIAPKIDELQEKTEIGAEAREIAVNGKAVIDYSENKQKIANMVGIPNTKKLPLLLAFDFDIVRLKDLHESIDGVRERIVKKDSDLRSYDVSKLKKQLMELIKPYYQILNWAVLRLDLETKYVLGRVTRFIREHYG